MSFTCADPDFAVRSTPDGTIFRVRRSALSNSEVFREPLSLDMTYMHMLNKHIDDMFLCCEESNDTFVDETLDLHEPVQHLSALLQLLHHLPEPPLELEVPASGTRDEDTASAKFIRERFLPRIPSYDRGTVIPLPVLQPMLFDLVDKYGLSIDIFKVLCLHLLAHVPTHPLRVYGFAASFEPRHHRRRSRAGPSGNNDNQDPAHDKFGVEAEKEMEKEMQKIASKASQFLEPIGSYSMQEVLDAIPSVRALHRVVQLQHLRIQALREVLNESEIFPKGEVAAVSFIASFRLPFFVSSFMRGPWSLSHPCIPFFPI